MLEFIKKVRASGGADAPEDVCEGFERALSQDWKAETKIVVHIADAPCHGTKFHDLGSYSDDYPSGDIEGREIED
jgi:hypothetical protein